MNKVHKIALGLIIVAIVATGTIAYASNETVASSQKQKGLQYAVSEGIISQQQADKICQSNQENIREKKKEMMQNRINTALEEGTITQQEADEIITWRENRPQALQKMQQTRKQIKNCCN